MSQSHLYHLQLFVGLRRYCPPRANPDMKCGPYHVLDLCSAELINTCRMLHRADQI